MKKFIFLINFFVLLNTFAQNSISGKIIDAQNGNTLPFANIILDDSKGTVANFKGVFYLNLSKKVDFFIVSYIGYQKKRIDIIPGKKYYIVKLQPSTETLQTVVIDGKYVNPAIALMKKAISRKYGNDYRKLLDEAFFKKYIKFIVTADVDRIDNKIFDTIYVNSKISRIDSSLYEMKKELSDKHIWMYETITEVFLKNGKEKNNVIATRIAGLKEPLYELIALQLTGHNVYDDNYKIFFKEYLGPFSKLSLKHYQYEIEDTITMQGRRVIEVSFKKNKKPFTSGKIYLDEKLFAIAKLEINLYKGFQYNAQYQFKFIQPQKFHEVWFLDNVRIKIKKAQNKDEIDFWDTVVFTEKNRDTIRITEKGDTIRHTHPVSSLDYIYGDFYLKNFDFKNFIPKSTPKYDLQISPDATQKTTEFWEKQTGIKKTEKEINTYTYIDSIAKVEKLDFNIKKLRKLLNGYLPVHRYFDMDLNKIMDYNRYEGLRVKLGGKTSDNFHNKLSLSGHLAYGFSDKEWKYSTAFRYKLNHNTQTFLKLTYQKDLQKSAGFYEIQNVKNFLEPQTHFTYDKFFMQKGFDISLTHLLSPKIKVELSYNQVDISTKYTIPFHSGLIEFLNKDLTFISLHSEITPFTKYVLTDEGRKIIKEGYPKFYLGFEKNITTLQIDQTDYFRIEAQTWLKKNWLNKDHTELFIQTGFASYQSGIDKLFMPNVNDFYGNNPLKHISISNRFAFETMKDMEFVDNIVSAAYLNHSFNKIKLSQNKTIDIELQAKVAYGVSFSSNSYVGIKSLENLYYETGIEFNRLINSLGLGVYYRLGYYAYPNVFDNISIRLTLRPFNFF